MRLLSVQALLLAALAPLALAACDDLNKPLGHPRSQPRKSCFSDVECPSNQKCVKGPQDVDGTCTPRTAQDGDGGTDTSGGEGGTPAPPPSITPQPGDIQI